MKYPSYSKLNLNLYVSRRQADGMHFIQSLFQEISLCDTLSITTRPSKKPSLSLSCSSREVPVDHRNIVAKLFKVVKEDLSHDYTINIEKHIPLGGGLGGSSTNAATVLTVMNDVEGWQLSFEQLSDIARNCGSDVSFFIKGGCQLVSGYGERCSVVDDAKEYHFLLAIPPVHCDTVEVYSQFDEIDNTQRRLSDEEIEALDLMALGYNDLLAAVLIRYPEMQRYYDRLSQLSHPVYLTGSGATFYFVLESRAAVELLIKDVQGLVPDCDLRYASTVKRCTIDGSKI